MSKEHKEWSKRELWEALRDNQTLSIDLMDALSDVIEGLKRWAEIKVGSCELSTEDEALIRWINASPGLRKVASVEDIREDGMIL